MSHGILKYGRAFLAGLEAGYKAMVEPAVVEPAPTHAEVKEITPKPTGIVYGYSYPQHLFKIED